MKLHILSDLHLEFAPFEIPDVGADVLVLAGDIGVGLQGVEEALRQSRGRPVVYVAGNHEYYRHEMLSLDEQMRARGSQGGVYVLENRAVVVGGVRFLGATLWTDFAVCGAERADALRNMARLMMSDYRLIRAGKGALTPEGTEQLCRLGRSWLAEHLDEPFAGPTVVVTHHAPSRKSWPVWLHEDALLAACVSDLEGLMGQERVALWVHGHTHWCVDYQVNGTRVVSNQRGYPHQKVPSFNPGFVVEV